MIRALYFTNIRPIPPVPGVLASIAALQDLPMSKPYCATFHKIRDVGAPIKDGPDSSTPKFNDDDEHIEDIARSNAGRGFPVLAIARTRGAK